MHIHIPPVVLRKPEPGDAAAFYKFRNNPDATNYISEHHRSFSIKDIEEWIEYHRNADNEAVWTIANAESNACLGHVGLYRINHRVGGAEAGLMIGDPDLWGKGLGRSILLAVLEFGFCQLNLHRIQGYILGTHNRSLRLVEHCGFRQEGVMREAHYVSGAYQDLVMVGVLRSEFHAARSGQ